MTSTADYSIIVNSATVTMALSLVNNIIITCLIVVRVVSLKAVVHAGVVLSPFLVVRGRSDKTVRS